MKKLLLIILLSLVSLSVFSQSKRSTEVILKLSSYITVSYDTTKLIAGWSRESLKPSMLKKNYTREDLTFTADSRMPRKYKVTTYDYTGSGYDRGHLTPAGDFSWNKTEMAKTFNMLNIVPQAPTLNRNSWRLLEEYIRSQVVSYDSAIVYTGTYGEIGKIKKKIVVPEYTWKIVYWYKNGKRTESAWIYKNSKKTQTREDCKISVDNLLRMVGRKRL